MKVVRLVSFCSVMFWYALQSTLVAAQEPSDWENAITAGGTAFEAEEFDRAAELYAATYDLASTPAEEIISRYYHAYAMSELGRLEIADAILAEAVQIAGDYEVDNPELLMALYGLAGDVAYELGDKLRGAELKTEATNLRPLDEDAWARDETTDAVQHVPSGVTLPLSVGEFRRDEAKTYREGGRDVSVSYFYRSDDGDDMWITVFLTGTEIYGNSEGELHTRQSWFEVSRDNIALRFGELDIAEDGEISVADREDLKPLFTLYRAKLGDPPADHMTGIIVEQIGDFFIKMRISYDADIGFDARVMLQNFVDSFDWPQVSTPEAASAAETGGLNIEIIPLLAENYPACGNEKPGRSKARSYRELTAILALSVGYIAEAKKGIPAPQEDGQTCLLESFEVGDVPVTVFWVRKPQGDRLLRYRFEIGEQGSLGAVTLSSSASLNQIMSELGGAGKKIYHIDAWDRDAISLLEMYKGIPSYKTVKKLVHNMINGKASSITSVSLDGSKMEINMGQAEK